MTDTQRRIADLEARRTALRQVTAGRERTGAERELFLLLDAAIAKAWELRRHERAQQPQIDHELIIVRTLKERTV